MGLFIRALLAACYFLGTYPSACAQTVRLTPSWFDRPQELLEKCHPLGMFDSIATLAVAANMRELYRLVLVDTPLAPYFAETLSSEDLDEMNIEILRNTLYKARLSCSAPFCGRSDALVKRSPAHAHG